MFSSNKISDIFRQMQTDLKGLYDEAEIRSVCYMLLEEITGLNKAEILGRPDYCVTGNELQWIFAAVGDLKNFRPVQHITGRAHFRGIHLTVTSDVLIPRPETEELVEWILKDHPKCTQQLHMLDIGTGSGCIALALAAELPGSAVTAADVSEAALEVARSNVMALKTQMELVKLDILNPGSEFAGRMFDVIVSNPPYVRESEKRTMAKNVLDYEPAAALFVPDEDPLVFYRAIFDFAKTHLEESGKLYLELNEALGAETLQLAADCGFHAAELRKDLSGRDRMLRCGR